MSWSPCGEFGNGGTIPASCLRGPFLVSRLDGGAARMRLAALSDSSLSARCASSLRSTSKKPLCPITRPLRPPLPRAVTKSDSLATWREEFFEAPIR